LESILREDEWYVVILPPDDKGFKQIGYIRADLVKVVEVAGETPVQAAPPPPPPPPNAAEPPPEYPHQLETYAATYEKLFSGIITKFGWLWRPDSGGIGQSWIAGVNIDIGLSRNIALGIELMPAYRSYSDPDLQIFPIQGYVNLKAGFNMGDVVRALGFMSPYAGAGGGLEAAYATASFQGTNSSNFSTQPAYHVFMGLQLKLGSLKLIGEYQWTRISDASVEPNFWRHYLLFGFRFGR